MPSKLFSYIILFCAVFFLSSSAIFVKLADAPSGITAFYRLGIAALALLPAVLHNPESRGQLLQLRGRRLILGVLSGFVLALHYVMWFESLKYTSVASSIVLVTMQPLFAIIGGWFIFRERYGWQALSGCLLAIAGSVIIGWGDLNISWDAFLGDLMALAAAAVIAAYFLIGQEVRGSMGAMPYSLLGYGSGAAFLALYSMKRGEPFTGYSDFTWMNFAGLALVSTILGQLVFNWLLKWLPAAVISMSILGETVGTCILSYFILGEGTTMQQLAGIACILSGIGIFLRSRG